MSTKIEWTDETWSPITGCTKISAGCANCYAERMARRLAGRYGYPKAPHHFDVTLRPERLEQPLRWRKPRMIFVCSMSDLFHEDVPFEFVDLVFLTMTACNGLHIFQVLTKRPGRMLEYFNSKQYYSSPQYHAYSLPNVWLGVTAENQAAADERIPLLLQTLAAVRFVSCEPLLGAINLNLSSMSSDGYKMLSHWYGPDGFDKTGSQPEREQQKLDWVIVGGESGPGARPMHPHWARSLRDQAQAAGVPYFFKQWGRWAPLGPVHYNPAFSGDHAARDPYGGGTIAIDGDILKNRRKYYHAFNADTIVRRVGKKRAGRLLDGREWNEFPVGVDDA